MARKKDKNSVRQRAFKLLDDIKNVKRDKALKVLKATFRIGDSYAATLHAAHRTINKQNGTMIKIFSVKTTKNGKIVPPYIKTENVFNPPTDACKTISSAKDKYLQNLNSKIALVKKL